MAKKQLPTKYDTKAYGRNHFVPDTKCIRMEKSVVVAAIAKNLKAMHFLRLGTLPQ